jgi:hypothetical protein
MTGQRRFAAAMAIWLVSRRRGDVKYAVVRERYGGGSVRIYGRVGTTAFLLRAMEKKEDAGLSVD